MYCIFPAPFVCNDGEEVDADGECDGVQNCADSSDEDPFLCAGGKRSC